jgi:hypothetical protein
MPEIDINKVSGLYGPGTYWAWILSMLSAAITLHKEHSNQEGSVPPDLIAASIYPLVAFIDMARRTNRNDIHWAQDFQAQAAFHVVYATSWCTAIFSLCTSSKFWILFMHVTLSALLNSVIMFNVLGGVLSRIEDEGDSKMTLVLSSGLAVSQGLSLFIYWAHRRRFRLSGQPDFIVAVLAFTLVHTFLARVELLPQSFSPRTGANISDLDQAASLATAIILLSYQWRLIPRYVASIFTNLRRTFVENEAVMLSTPTKAVDEPPQIESVQ